MYTPGIHSNAISLNGHYVPSPGMGVAGLAGHAAMAGLYGVEEDANRIVRAGLVGMVLVSGLVYIVARIVIAG